jgi:hypothetical protein
MIRFPRPDWPRSQGAYLYSHDQRSDDPHTGLGFDRTGFRDALERLDAY